MMGLAVGSAACFVCHGLELWPQIFWIVSMLLPRFRSGCVLGYKCPSKTHLPYISRNTSITLMVQAFPPNRSWTLVNKMKTKEDILMIAGSLNSRSGMGFKIQHPTQPTAMSQSLPCLLILDQFLYHLLQVRPDRPFDTHTLLGYIAGASHYIPPHLREKHIDSNGVERNVKLTRQLKGLLNK
jgi:hypothetical protein